MADISSIKLPDGTAYTVKDSTARNHIGNKNNPHGVTAGQIGAVAKTGDTMTGGLNAEYFSTGEAEESYFRCKKFRGEGNANTYYHAIDYGYAGHNMCDFHEYGGVWNFYKNENGLQNSGILVGAITPNGWSGKVDGHTISADVPAGAKFTDTTYSIATQKTNGLMSSDDKAKLDSLSTTSVSAITNSEIDLIVAS
jgi:hypothetical protein|nr:MAG TPA: hypothetical protein [Caudoviricetes sp.]